MAENNKYAITLFHADGSSNTVGYQGLNEESAKTFIAEEYDLNIDDKGNVTGDPDITKITIEAKPDMRIHHEEHEEQDPDTD